jgi:hypothetical protein
MYVFFSSVGRELVGVIVIRFCVFRDGGTVFGFFFRRGWPPARLGLSWFCQIRHLFENRLKCHLVNKMHVMWTGAVVFGERGAL